MTRPKLNQTALLEVVVSKIDSLESTKKEYDKLFNNIKAELNRLEEIHKQPISIDMDPIHNVTARVEKVLLKSIRIPRWFLLIFIISIISLFASLFMIYHQYQYIEMINRNNCSRSFKNSKSKADSLKNDKDDSQRKKH